MVVISYGRPCTMVAYVTDKEMSEDDKGEEE